MGDIPYFPDEMDCIFTHLVARPAKELGISQKDVIDMGKVSPGDGISLIVQKWEKKQAREWILRGPLRPRHP
jgi:hypothetical protein